MNHRIRNLSLSLTILLSSMIVSFGVSAQGGNPQFDHLEPVGDPQVAAAFIDPEADFSVFKRIMVLDTTVAFRSNWVRDQRRQSIGNRITTNDVERIKARVSELFNSVLIDTLEADDGFEITDQPDYDVLLIRAAIIDLDVAAPDVRGSARNRTFTASSGAATVYMELFDSVSGQIIGRAVDRQIARDSGTMRWTNRATNTADARRVFRGWANTLRGFLESHYSGK